MPLGGIYSLLEWLLHFIFAFCRQCFLHLSLLHLKFVFIYNASYGSNFTFFQVGCQLFQYPLVSKLSFPNELKYKLCHILNFSICYFTYSSLYIWQYRMNSVTTITCNVFVHSNFIKWPGRAFSHLTFLPTVLFLFSNHLSWLRLGIWSLWSFYLVGVEITLNLQINFGKLNYDTVF